MPKDKFVSKGVAKAMPTAAIASAAHGLEISENVNIRPKTPEPTIYRGFQLKSENSPNLVLDISSAKNVVDQKFFEMLKDILKTHNPGTGIRI